TWRPTGAPEHARHRPRQLRHFVAAHIQEMRENIGDETHFTVVHDRPLAAPMRFAADGPRATLELTGTYPVIGALGATVEMEGPGILHFRIGGFAKSCVTALTTPIDAHTSELRLLISAENVWGVPLSRLIHALVLKWIAR